MMSFELRAILMQSVRGKPVGSRLGKQSLNRNVTPHVLQTWQTLQPNAPGQRKTVYIRHLQVERGRGHIYPSTLTPRRKPLL